MHILLAKSLNLLWQFYVQRSTEVFKRLYNKNFVLIEVNERNDKKTTSFYASVTINRWLEICNHFSAVSAIVHDSTGTFITENLYDEI